MSNSSKKSPKSGARRGSDGAAPWASGSGRAFALILLIAAVTVAGWFVVWQDVNQHVFDSDDYWLRRGDIQMTPLPRWIHSDVRAQVLRNASLDEPLSIMEPGLSQKIAEAFAMHPWVAHVDEVRIGYPAKADVALKYRKPVLMVEVAGGLLPTDRDGVLLPSGDFSPVEAARYPRLVGFETYPLGPVGTPWGDNRVTAAAEIVDCLGDEWHGLKLDRIAPADTRAAPLGRSNPTAFELITRGGTRVLWGRAPSQAPPGSPSAAEKVARLVQYVERYGSLEGPQGPQQIDLTGPDRLRITRRESAEPGKRLE